MKTKWREYELPARPTLSEHPGDRWIKTRAEAFDPTVIVSPPNWEVYNCTTCGNAEPEPPANKKDANIFRVRCKGNNLWNKGMWNEGPRFEDIGCTNWVTSRSVLDEQREYRRKI
jgi:hypothetical protein